MARRLSYIYGIALLAALLSSACNRGGDNSSSMTIVIRAPSHMRSLNFPGGKTACYGINVTGSGIKSETRQCGPVAGIKGGFVLSGQEISALVPKNLTVTVDLYVYLKDTTDTSPCPPWDVAMSAGKVPNVYQIGTATNVSTASDQVDVNITGNYTGTSLASQLSLPAVCTASAQVAPSPFAIDSGFGLATGTNLQMKARLGSSRAVNELSNANFKIKVR